MAVAPGPRVPPPAGVGSSRAGIQRYVYGTTALWGVSVGLLSATLPFRFLQLGLPIFEYGVTLSAYAAGMLLTESLWGAWAFRLGQPVLIAGVGAVVGAATLLLAVATSFPTILVAEVVIGAVGVYLAPILRWVALTHGGPGSEGTGSGRWSSVFGLGIAVGVAMGPVAFVSFGFRDVALGSLATFALAVAVAAALPWARVALPTPVKGRGLSIRILATRPFLIAIGLVLITFTAMTFTTSFLQYYSIVLFGGTPSDAGYVLGAGRLVSLTASFVLGPFVDRWGPGRTVPVGFGLLLVGAVATWGARSYLDMVGATLVFSAGLGWLFANLLPLGMNAMPRDHQGAAIGVFGSMEDAGLLVGPLLFGAAWSAYGPTSLFPTVTALAASGVLVSLLVTARRGGAIQRKVPPATGGAGPE